MSKDVEMNPLLRDAIERSFRPSADGGRCRETAHVSRHNENLPAFMQR